MSEYVFKTDSPIRTCSECDYRCGLNIIARKDQDGRHENCPLKELPEHGDLIDRDKLAEAFEKYEIEEASVFDILFDASTILEASEE